MKTKYSNIPNTLYYNYTNKLINKLYKIIPLKEGNCPTVDKYISGLLMELSGYKSFIIYLNYDARILSIINTLEFIKNNELDHDTYRDLIFKCINNTKQIQESIDKDDI